jgi:GTP-binding protein Era
MEQQDFRSGFVALAGRPNVGKSTLLNAMVGETVAIATHLPQTTRTRVRGIVSRPHSQIVFVDTPGIHDRSQAINQFMLAEARAALSDVDLAVVLIEARGRGRRPEHSQEDRLVLTMLATCGCRSLLAINKIDQLKDKSHLLPIIQEYDATGLFEAIVPVSALRRKGLEDLLAAIESRLAPGPCFFPPEMITDQPERELAAEFIREQAIIRVGQEVPYSLAVEIENFEELPGRQKFFGIHAVMHVERFSQKGILIGKHGSMLSEIGKAARKRIEKMLGCRVHLDLRVKLARKWAHTKGGLKRVGYKER